MNNLPEIFETESNHTLASGQPITLPVIVNGRIDKPGYVDTFRFDAKAGDEIVADLMARRLNSPLDSTLEITDSSGKRIAFNDDCDDKACGLETHHADSYLRAKLPSTGTYFIRIADAQRQGGPDFGYRLRLSPPQPDFELRVVPSSVVVRPGVAVPLKVYALRKDGFTNSISLRLKNAEGFFLSGATIPANQDEVRFTLSARPTRQTGPFRLQLEGTAHDGKRELTHPAVPAEDMMQAFAYRHLVPANELDAMVAGSGMGRGLIQVAGVADRGSSPDAPIPLQISAGCAIRVRFTGVGPAFADRFKIELSDPPDGISLSKVSPTINGVELELAADASKTKPGSAGNLIFNLFAERNAGPAKAKSPVNNRRLPVGSLPAVPFEVVATR
jgi:hypothetical protein